MPEHVHNASCESLEGHEVFVENFIVGMARHPQHGSHISFTMELDGGRKVTAILSPSQALTVSQQCYTLARKAIRENKEARHG